MWRQRSGQLHVGAESARIQVLSVQVIEDLHLSRLGGKTHLPAAGILGRLFVGHLTIIIIS